MTETRYEEMQGRKSKFLFFKNLGSSSALTLLVVVFSSLVASAGQVEMEYSFERPFVRKTTLADKQYDKVILAGAPASGTVGFPALPARGARILIPYGHSVVGIEAVPGEKVFLGSNYLIEPIAEPVCALTIPETYNPPEPDMDIYGSSGVFPETLFNQVGVYTFRGYQILVLKLLPVQYVPKSGELFYYPTLTVRVSTTETGTKSPLLRGLEKDESELYDRVDNPQVVAEYPAASSRRAAGFDLLILTTPALAESFQPLKSYHDSTGISTEIHTIDDVGSNNPDDVRDYIRDLYLRAGIEYVLIGEDDNRIPAKDLYVRRDSTSESIVYDMPADLYFACLDGTFNYDGDSLWGEPNDGDYGGDVDLLAEVYVGRMTAGQTEEVALTINKTITYLSQEAPYLQKVLMCGERMGWQGVSEYAGTFLDEMIDASDAHGYTTVGIPSEIHDIFTLYDRDWIASDWPAEELIGRINGGVHIINHQGHGLQDLAMKVEKLSVPTIFTNHEFCFIYSQACLAGHFDGLDCWAEYMNLRNPGGAFALVMNAREGWGTHNTTDGPSQRFAREFWDAIYNPLESKPELGRANQDSKEDNLYRIDEAAMRWCYYGLTLFGDPSVALKTELAPLEDGDGDGVADIFDNCITLPNPDQEDADSDGWGNPCDDCTDTDHDGFGDPGYAANSCPDDNCPQIDNPDQLDADADGSGDVCDECTDTDSDGFGDPGYIHNICPEDNCPHLANPDQVDANHNSVGDACESCCINLTGNVDVDPEDTVDLGDLTALIDYLFIGFQPLACDAEANIDGDLQGVVDLGDLTALIDYLFISFTNPATCHQ